MIRRLRLWWVRRRLAKKQRWLAIIEGMMERDELPEYLTRHYYKYDPDCLKRDTAKLIAKERYLTRVPRARALRSSSSLSRGSYGCYLSCDELGVHGLNEAQCKMAERGRTRRK